MKTKNAFIVFLLCVLIQLPISNLIGQANAPINLGNNWEVWYDKVPVSGEIRVGIVTATEEIAINPTSFFVMIPNHSEKYLFCEISSRDGRYEASLTYDISGLKKGSHIFVLPTKHVDDLEEYSTADITILTSISSDVNSEANFYTIASWKPVTKLPEKVFIYLNSAKTTTIVAENKSTNERLEFPCRKIESPASIAYNSICEIPSNVITAKTELFIKQRVRRMNKITYNSYPISIKKP